MKQKKELPKLEDLQLSDEQCVTHGHLMQRARKKAGYTQDEVAGILNRGAGYVSTCERGISCFTGHEYYVLARLYKVNVNAFFEGLLENDEDEHSKLGMFASIPDAALRSVIRCMKYFLALLEKEEEYRKKQQLIVLLARIRLRVI